MEGEAGVGRVGGRLNIKAKGLPHTPCFCFKGSAGTRLCWSSSHNEKTNLGLLLGFPDRIYRGPLTDDPACQQLITPLM